MGWGLRGLSKDLQMQSCNTARSVRLHIVTAVCGQRPGEGGPCALHNPTIQNGIMIMVEYFVRYLNTMNNRVQIRNK